MADSYFMFLYVACFAISIGPLGWLIISEIFPQKVRGLGASVGSLSVWVFNSIVSLHFQIVNALTMPGSEVIIDGERLVIQQELWIYGFIAMMALVWGYFMYLKRKEYHWKD